MSGTSGGEDYAQPTATTAPGVTTYTLQEPGSVDPAYFVVRARDAAGVSDNNTREREAVDSCTGGAQEGVVTPLRGDAQTIDHLGFVALMPGRTALDPLVPVARRGASRVSHN